jgi:hypothetical protein
MFKLFSSARSARPFGEHPGPPNSLLNYSLYYITMRIMIALAIVFACLAGAVLSVRFPHI